MSRWEWSKIANLRKTPEQLRELADCLERHPLPTLVEAISALKQDWELPQEYFPIEKGDLEGDSEEIPEMLWILEEFTRKKTWSEITPSEQFEFENAVVRHKKTRERARVIIVNGRILLDHLD